MVYYDLLGFTFIAYSESTGQIINIVVAIASVIVSYYILQAKGIKPRYVRKEILYGFFITICAFILGNIVCFLIATELDFSEKSMSWYHRTIFSITLYCFPSAAVHVLFYSQSTSTRDSPLSLGLKAQARLNGVNLFWALVTIVLMALGYRTAYIFMVPILITLLTNIFIGALKAQNSRNNDYLMIQIHANKIENILLLFV